MRLNAVEPQRTSVAANPGCRATMRRRWCGHDRDQSEGIDVDSHRETPGQPATNPNCARPGLRCRLDPRALAREHRPRRHVDRCASQCGTGPVAPAPPPPTQVVTTTTAPPVTTTPEAVADHHNDYCATVDSDDNRSRR